MKTPIDEIISLLPEHHQKILASFSDGVRARINEIRLRVGKPVVFNLGDESIVAKPHGSDSSEMLNVTKKDLVDTFSKICNYSVYSYQNEIKNGFITLKGGHRVGLCGTAVFNNTHMTNIKDISSMNIRIARQVSNFNVDICKLFGLNFTGILIIGSPGAGKTTLLKSLAKNYSIYRQKRFASVCVVDERGEISGAYSGVPQFDLGHADILNGYKKSDGIAHAIRALAPDIIICDEILVDDFEAIKSGINSGVKFIASTHASTSRELLRKPYINDLIRMGAFDKFVFLADKSTPSTIKSILSLDELLSKENQYC